MSHQKRKTDKTSLPPASTQTQTTHLREESHPKETKRKKKNHTTHSRLTNHSTPRPQPDTQTRIQSLPHTSFLHPCHKPSLHPTHILSTHLLTFAHTPTPTVPPPCLHPCSQLYPCLSRSRYRSPSTCVPLPDGRYVPRRLATTARLYRYPAHCCLHTVHMFVCTTALACCCLGFSPCAHLLPSFSPSVCHPGCLRYHQSLTRVHSHSLPPTPPLPLADARSQGGSVVGRSRSLAYGLWCPLVCLCASRSLTLAHVPHVCSLSVACIHVNITTLTAPPLVRIHAHSPVLMLADIPATSSVHMLAGNLYPVLPA